MNSIFLSAQKKLVKIFIVQIFKKRQKVSIMRRWKMSLPISFQGPRQIDESGAVEVKASTSVRHGRKEGMLEKWKLLLLPKFAI